MEVGEMGDTNKAIELQDSRPEHEGIVEVGNGSSTSGLRRNESNLSISSKMTSTGKTLQLELVLPNQMLNEDPHGFDSVSGMHRRSRPASRTGSILESKSPGFVNTRLVNYNRGLSHQPSIISNHHTNDEHIPPPSTEEEKSKMTRRYFATIFAISYAIFLVVFGFIVFIGNAVTNYNEKIEFDPYPIGQIFCIYMLTVAMAYFIFLYIDIRLHIRKARKAVRDREEQMRQYEEQMAHVEDNLQSALELRRTANGNINVQIPLPDVMVNPLKKISHRYCFATGRHGEFLYLKLGAAWFCFGLLIHSILNISYQATYLSMDPECIDVLTLTVDILFPIYSLGILFFIFKYINVIINCYRGVARVLLMHAVGTTLAFWILTIVRETVNAINLKYQNYDYDASEKLKMPISRAVDCPSPDDLNTIRATISPYLYPFVIEFCILVVGIYYMIWGNINKCPKKMHGNSHHGHDHSNKHAGKSSLAVIHEEPHKQMPVHRSPSAVSDHCNNLGHDNDYRSNIVVYADCHKASRGLFAGMLLMILKIVFIILLHIAANNPEYVETGVLIDNIFELVILIILIVATIVAYFQTSKLDINHHPISKLDDVLLFIAIPAFFSETIFSMVPAIVKGRIINILIIMTQLIQILIQTPWIIDGLRRCSNSPILRQRKPGRELVTFLLIANVSLWIYYTFSVRTADTLDINYEFYGYRAWSIINHVSLPLIMFYRFHASVCLVDIWRHSYEPGEFSH